jgi:hypothetical protein
MLFIANLFILLIFDQIYCFKLTFIKLNCLKDKFEVDLKLKNYKRILNNEG